MDIGDLRGLATILCMIAFLAIVFWAYSPSRKKRFEEAANLPFGDDERGEADAAKRSEKRAMSNGTEQ